MSTNWVQALPLLTSVTGSKLSLSKMADDRDLEVTQVDENRRNNSQRSLFFKDLDELLSEYQPTNNIAITESSTIRLENAVQALQNVCHFLS